MLTREEVLELAHEFNLTVDPKDVFVISSERDVMEKVETGNYNYTVNQKKKGKPTKKISICLRIKEDSKFISSIYYAAMASIQDFKEMFRKVNSSNFQEVKKNVSPK